MTALPFPDKVSIASSADIKDSVVSVKYGDNYEQVANDGINAEYELWTIIWPYLDDTEFDAAMATLQTVGCHTPMTWQSPIDGTTKYYRMQPNTRQPRAIVSGAWSLSIQIKEVAYSA
ncbi:phage tail protein [Methylomonas sp. MED-D]|uniref:phage tail protein n=1 Tax=Methylomonas sp. MED-D TaxID=3418768 RepID=UPI003CFCF0E6